MHSQLIPRACPREIRGTCRADFSRMTATKQLKRGGGKGREATGLVRAVYKRRLKLASQQVILVHAVYSALHPQHPRNSEFRLEATNHALEIVMLAIVCCRCSLALRTVIILCRIDLSLSRSLLALVNYYFPVVSPLFPFPPPPSACLLLFIPAMHRRTNGREYRPLKISIGDRSTVGRGKNARRQK